MVTPPTAGCGCGGGVAGGACVVKSGGALTVRQVERACMCAVCPRVSADGKVCTVSGARVSVHVKGEWLQNGSTCPRGVHPDSRGRVRWGGVAWLGVPAPVRWWLKWRRGMDQAKLPGGKLPRCGCIDSLKRVAEWLSRVTGGAGQRP